MKNFIKYICISCMLLINMVSIAQGQKLVIGNPIKWQKNHRQLDGKEELPVEKFGSKLVLLDFFTTSCTSCIASFPFMNDLQGKFKDEVQVLMVTPETKAVVAKFFRKNDYVKANKLPVVIEDTWFSDSFPHKGVPHVAWIYQDTVVAITGKDMVTLDNIDRVLTNKDLSKWPIKDDFAIDTAMDVNSQEGDSYSSMFRPYKIGYPLKYRIDSTSHKIAYHMTNVDAIPALLYVIGLERKLPLMKKERIILNVRNRDRFVNVDSIPKSFWLQKNAFCFSSEWPVEMDASQRHAALLNELTNRLNIRVTYEPRDVKVWVIRPSKQKGNALSTGDMEIGNWLTFVEVTNPHLPPLIIEGIPINTKAVSSYEISDLASLKKAMEGNGLLVEETGRKIDCLVIDDN